jgi:membrane protease YdiL (CAAX protease family)
MTENNSSAQTEAPSKFASFFFHNKASLTVILLIMILATILLPGAGAVVPIVITVIALLGSLRYGSVKMLGLNRPSSWPKTLFLGAVVGIAVQMLFNILLDPIFELITGTHIDLSNLANIQGNFTNYIFWITIGWVIGGFFEELSFRGYIITRVRSIIGENSLGTTIAILLSVIPFGIAHLYQDWAGVLSACFMGFYFALLYIRNRYNLWLPILVHGFANMTDITLIYFGLSDTFRLF